MGPSIQLSQRRSTGCCSYLSAGKLRRRCPCRYRMHQTLLPVEDEALLMRPALVRTCGIASVDERSGCRFSKASETTRHARNVSGSASVQIVGGASFTYGHPDLRLRAMAQRHRCNSKNSSKRCPRTVCSTGMQAENGHNALALEKGSSIPEPYRWPCSEPCKVSRHTVGEFAGLG